jgi:hypothetical protein
MEMPKHTYDSNKIEQNLCHIKKNFEKIFDLAILKSHTELGSE